MNHWLQKFWERPQGTFARRALFQIHLWVGIGVGLYIFLMSISGVALVFREELEPVLQSNERTVMPGAQRLSFDTLRRNIETKFAGYHVTWMIEPEQPHQAMTVWFEKGKDERIALVNPYDGTLIREAKRTRTLFGFLQDLHFYLLLGDAGWTANGIGAILLFLLCLTGFIIWWPGIKNWTRGLKIKRGTSWKRFNWDMHNAVGFWTLLFITIWGITGAYFVFPEPFHATVNLFAPLTPRPMDEKPQPVPAETALASIDAMVANAAAVTPGELTTWIQAPRREGLPARVYRKPLGAHEETTVYLHPATAQVTQVQRPTERTTGDTIIRWFGWLHFGTFAGAWSKAFWLVLGLAPALLFVTGFFMWWNRVVCKALRNLKRTPAPVALHEPAPLAVHKGVKAMIQKIIYGLYLLLFFAPLTYAEEILYVHNTLSGEITMISIPGHEIIGEIKIGLYMDYVTASPDGRILYVNRIDGMGYAPAPNIGDSGELIAVSTATNQILWRLAIDGMTHHMTVSQDGRYVFVPLWNTWWLAVVSTEQRKVIKKIYIGHGGHGTKLSSDGKRLYVGSMLNDLMAIIDTEKLEVVDRIPFRDSVRPFVLTRDEKRLYVQLSRLHGFVVVELPTKKQLQIVPLPALPPEIKLPEFYPHNVNHGLALSPDEKLLFANGSIANYLCVFSHPDLKLLKTIPVGRDPNAILFSKDGRFAYVTNRQSDDLSIIDVQKLAEIKRLKLGRYPQRMVIVNVPERSK